MPNATPVCALPYPLGGEDVRDGNDAIKALADRLELFLSSQFSNRNVIRNGDFTVNQRGFGPFTATGVYTADGWRKDHVGGTHTILNARSAGATNQYPSYYKNYVKSTVTGQSAAGDFAQYCQRIEDVRTLANRDVTLTIEGFSGTYPNTKVGIEIVQMFGTGGSPSGLALTSIGQIIISGDNDSQTSVTFKMPSISGKTLGTNNDSFLQINFWVSAGATYAARASNIGIQNNEVYFYLVQLEDGKVATPFEWLNQQKQLAWCQRYFQRINANSGGGSPWGTGFAFSTTQSAIMLPYKTTMRAIPALGNVASLGVYSPGGTPLASTVTTRDAVTNLDNAYINIQVASGLTAGQGIMGIFLLNTGYLELTAEL